MIIGPYKEILIYDFFDNEDIKQLFRYFLIRWPNSVIETMDGSIIVSSEKALLSGTVYDHDIFLYESVDAYESWTLNGYTDEFADKMIGISKDELGINFTLNDASSPMRDFIDAAVSTIWQHNRW